MPNRSASADLSIFISYRRADASGHAGRLYDALVARYGRARVFMDIDTIRPGSDFTKVLDTALAGCDVVLVLIGQNWAGPRDHRGRRRLDDPHDFVRRELEAALERDVTVVPLLVQDAPTPAAEHLPGTLSRLATRQAFELSDRRWRSDMKVLTDELDHLQRVKADNRRRSRRGERIITPTDPTESRPVRGGTTTVVGAFLSVLGLILGVAGEPLWLLGPLVLVIGAVMLVMTRRWRAAEAGLGSDGYESEPWHGILALASVGLAGLAVAGIMLLKGPAIGPFATTTGGIVLLVVATAAYLSRGWTAFDALPAWRQVVVAFVAALVFPAAYFAAVWVTVAH